MMPILRPTSLQIAVAELRVELARRGMGLARLAELTGYDQRSLGQHIAGGVPTWSLRFKIERALDFHPLWSSDPELWGRRLCLERFGCDPRLLTFEKLRTLCRKVGMENPGCRQREAWFQTLMGWLAAHPQTNKKTEPIENIC